MVKSCCAIGCTNRFRKKTDGGVRLYRFPADPERRERWCNAVKRMVPENRLVSWTPSVHSYLCAAHFIGGEKSDDPLHPAYVPSLFEFVPSPKKRKLERSISRHARIQAMERKRQSVSAVGQESQLMEESSSMGQPNQETTGDVSCVSVATQTTLDMEHLTKLEEDLQAVRNELYKARSATSCTSEEELERDNRRVTFYTGLPNFQVLHLVFNMLSVRVVTGSRSVLSPFQEMMIFLMRLRLNLSVQDLAYRFGVSPACVSRVVKKWLNVSYDQLRWLVRWPGREELRLSMPRAFKLSFPRCAAIIDCFEVLVERPTDFNARASSWSNYKQRNTCKYLIAITPQGSISFVSKGYGGRASDKQITDECGILDQLLPGDQILADRGFTIQESVGLHYAEVVIPDFTRGKKQLSGRAVERSRRIAHVRIHVERVIGVLRQKYTILNGAIPLTVVGGDMGTKVDKIVTVCAALCNLCPSIVSK